MILFFTVILASVLSFSSCHPNVKKQPVNKTSISEIPVFSADSAWHFTEAQTLFGPRVPNSSAHEACQAYLVKELKRTGAIVIEQNADLKAFDNTILKSTNIIASFYPEKTSRILLCAHWDSRPWADQDSDPSNHKKPVLGANDGASGVGVLLEIARIIGQDSLQNKPAVGVDIILFDAEDYGYPTFHEGPENEESWCLGSHYWAKNLHTPGYKAKYGILLDMVGGRAPTFYYESYSLKYAPDVTRKVWSLAADIGHGNMFLPSLGGAVTDDHVSVCELAKIPCIDIIDYDPGNPNSFNETWHTIYDTMDNIDPITLKAVGETILQVLYSE